MISNFEAHNLANINVKVICFILKLGNRLANLVSFLKTFKLEIILCAILFTLLLL
jgi:hypothetical protein